MGESCYPLSLQLLEQVSLISQGGRTCPPPALFVRNNNKEKCSPKLFGTFMLENKEVVTVAQKKMQLLLQLLWQRRNVKARLNCFQRWLYARVDQRRFHKDSCARAWKDRAKTISAFISKAYRSRCIKITKIATNLSKTLPLKSSLHEPLKLFFKIKVAQNCSSQSHLTLARWAEITLSRYGLTLFAGYLTNGPLAERYFA